VDVVTPDDVHWAGLPDREEAGSPNVVGAIAMAAAARVLMDVGVETMQRHEASLVAYALERLRSVPGIRIYGEAHPSRHGDRVGVIPFNLDGVPHALVAAILGYEGGIGVRNGCFCAQPYVGQLLGVSSREAARLAQKSLIGDRSERPGMVRASLAAYNTVEDLDALVEMLVQITAGRYLGHYRLAPESGDYVPARTITVVEVPPGHAAASAALPS
jgi:selenocysteine lyase/cysteine desulfurase